MQFKSKRKELISVGLEKKHADIMRVHSDKLFRSVSETIRLIVAEHIEQNQLEEKYSAILEKM